MKAIRTFLFSSAFATAAASLLVTSFAIAATDPAKGKAAGAADENAIIKLTPKQKLPKSIKQLTIIEHDEGDKSAAAATSENAVLVHYSGWLYDATKPDGKGDQFETTGKGKLPFGFFLGAGKVIKGWERGIVGMKPKGKRTLIIPPALGYGETARPKIPANSTLVFDIELVDILGARDKPAGAGGAANSATTSTTTQATPPPIVPPPSILPPVFIAAKDTLPVAPTQLTIIEHAVGEGAAAENGNTVAVHYTGWLYEPSQPGGKGKKFDSSVDRNQTFKFPLGGGRVIKGWDQGVLGMKAKGKRTLIIPAELGYGARSVGNGLIPANSTLIFDVELIEIPPA